MAKCPTIGMPTRRKLCEKATYVACLVAFRMQKVLVQSAGDADFSVMAASAAERVVIDRQGRGDQFQGASAGRWLACPHDFLHDAQLA